MKMQSLKRFFWALTLIFEESFFGPAIAVYHNKITRGMAIVAQTFPFF